VTALYFHGYKIDIQADKSRDPLRYTVTGANVYASSVVSALLKYGSYDQYIFPTPHARWLRKTLNGDAPKVSERIQYVQGFQLRALQAAKDLVMMTPNPGLRPLHDLRKKIRRPRTPMIGVVHSLHTHDAWETMLLNQCLPLQDFDSIFVSSDAGLEVCRQRLKCLRAGLKGTTKKAFSLENRFAKVPIGIEVEEAQSRLNDRGLSRQHFDLDKATVAILYFGRLCSKTKADLIPLLLVFADLLKEEDALHLFLAGDDTLGGQSKSLCSVVESLGISHKVTVIPDPSQTVRSQLMHAADIFVSPSDSIQETFGITLLEAMAAGLPTVVSNWSGYRDIVVDGVTGFLIPTCLSNFSADITYLRGSGNMLDDDLLASSTIVDMRSLRSALKYLVKHEDLRLEFGAAARARVISTFHWRKIISDYESIWSNLLSSAAASPLKRGLASSLMPADTTLFRHYSTQSLDASTPIRLAPTPFLSSPKIWPVLSQPEGLYDESVFAAILAALEDIAPATSRALHNKLREDLALETYSPMAGIDAILLHVGRLMKYGLVQRCESTATAERTIELLRVSGIGVAK
jgi:D-inositol-3-phosphate glycosyltransferase